MIGLDSLICPGGFAISNLSPHCTRRLTTKKERRRTPIASIKISISLTPLRSKNFKVASYKFLPIKHFSRILKSNHALISLRNLILKNFEFSMTKFAQYFNYFSHLISKYYLLWDHLVTLVHPYISLRAFQGTESMVAMIWEISLWYTKQNKTNYLPTKYI